MGKKILKPGTHLLGEAWPSFLCENQFFGKYRILSPFAAVLHSYVNCKTEHLKVYQGTLGTLELRKGRIGYSWVSDQRNRVHLHTEEVVHQEWAISLMDLLIPSF